MLDECKCVIINFEGHVFDTDSDIMYELEYVVVSGYYKLTPIDPPPSDVVNGGPARNQFVVAFSGCELKQDQVKDWLRSCAKQVHTIVYSMINEETSFNKLSATNNFFKFLTKIVFPIVMALINPHWNCFFNKVYK